MESVLFRIGRRFMPGFDTMTGQERAYWLSDALGLLYAAPLALLGLVWLAKRTRLEPAWQHWPEFLLAVALVFLFRQLDTFGFVEIKTGLYADWGSTFDTIPAWSAALIVGPAAFWPGLLLYLITFVWKWRSYASASMRLTRLRHLALDIGNDSLLVVLALTLYERWGGVYPLPGIHTDVILLAISATFAWYLLSSLLWAPYYFLAFLPPSASLPASERRASIRIIARLYTTAEILPALLSPYAVLSASMVREYGFWMYALTLSGLVLPAFLANGLSRAAERSYHRTRELERLERLSTAIIDAPSDASTLPDLLREHVPGMFPDSQVEVRIYPATTLLRSSQDFPPVPEAAWEWLRGCPTPELGYFLRGEAHPWNRVRDDNSYLVAPVYSLSSGELVGGVCVVVRWWPNKIMPYFLTAVQSLATLVASTLHQAEMTAAMLSNERVAQELALAGEIQAGLLPQELPQPPGWNISAALEPTRETSGDFYDAIPLPSGRLGILVADVADKGIGAALYMTLSRTLIRSYAIEHEHRPDLVMRAVNQRLLDDTRLDMFVTIFYGVLDPITGRLDYCNAGHNPPYLFNPRKTSEVFEIINEGQASISTCTAHQAKTPEVFDMIALKNTGMALGVLEDAPLQRAYVQIEPGSTLVLYTDGIPDARNEAGEYFDDRRLQEASRSCLGRPVNEMQEMILTEVHEFMGEMAQEDDITLMILLRD